MQRAQPETDLKKQGQKKRGGVETHAAQAAGHRADAEGTYAQKSQIEDRVVMPPRVPEVEQQDCKSGGKEQDAKTRGHDRASEIFNGKLQKGEPDPGNNKAAEIEPGRRRRAEVVD